jgi:hypothetical protein
MSCRLFPLRRHLLILYRDLSMRSHFLLLQVAYICTSTLRIKSTSTSQYLTLHIYDVTQKHSREPVAEDRSVAYQMDIERVEVSTTAEKVTCRALVRLKKRTGGFVLKCQTASKLSAYLA